MLTVESNPPAVSEPGAASGFWLLPAMDSRAGDDEFCGLNTISESSGGVGSASFSPPAQAGAELGKLAADGVCSGPEG